MNVNLNIEPAKFSFLAFIHSRRLFARVAPVKPHRFNENSVRIQHYD
jgi:hypothetical protein